jgi:hypothetical protein
MATVHEQFSEQFLSWEEVGRGLDYVFDFPVTPAPPFKPFPGYRLAPQDDGRRHTRISGWLDCHDEAEEPEEEDHYELFPWVTSEPLVEIGVYLPPTFQAKESTLQALLHLLSEVTSPITVEWSGHATMVCWRWVVDAEDAPLIHRSLSVHFPAVAFILEEGNLARAWHHQGDATAIFELGLTRECYYPIAKPTIDPGIALASALSSLSDDEMGVYQMTFVPTKQVPWSDSIRRTMVNGRGEPIFRNGRALLQAAEKKMASPLYGVRLRLAVRTPAFERLPEALRALALPWQAFAHPQGNAFRPFENTHDEEADLLERQSHRAGMLLNLDELIGLIGFPTPDVPDLARARQKTKPAPLPVPHAELFLGFNEHRGIEQAVCLSTEQRARHMHVVGASGSGKTTFLRHLLQQDIQHGEGFAILDPHGDLIDDVLGALPEHRWDDVILVDPADETASIAFNILSAHSDAEKNLLASDLVSVFRRLSTSWGDQMSVVLRQAILAFLESSEGGSLSDLRRFLLDSHFRAQFLTTVKDHEVVYFWETGFAQLTGNRSVGPILTRLESFLSLKPVRYMVSQKTNALDFQHIMDTGKIFLARLSQGLIGHENAHLLGSLMVSKFHQAAMSRQRQQSNERRPFWLYIDECQAFLTPSVGQILTEARKYRLGLILAHQNLSQLKRSDEVASAALGNTATRLVFQVADEDARALAHGFDSFDAADLQHLERGQAIGRIERADHDFNLRVPPPIQIDATQAERSRRIATDRSRQRYATPRAEIEAALAPVSRKPTPSVPTSPATIPPQTQGQEKNLPPAPTIGRGGPEHLALQRQLKEAAEALGYRAELEKTLATGGCVDVSIDQIACEISVGNAITYEVGNLNKCLQAGYQQVLAICNDASRLSQWQEAAQTALDTLDQIQFFTLDEAIAFLQEGAGSPKEHVSHGREIHRQEPAPEDLASQQAILHRVLKQVLGHDHDDEENA